MAKPKKRRLTKLARGVLMLCGLGTLWMFSGSRDHARPPAEDAVNWQPGQPEAAALMEVEAQSSKAAATTLTIASWNLEWFGTPAMRGIPARSRDAIKAISEAITSESRPGVIVLNEINVASQSWATLSALLNQEGYQSIQPAQAASQQETVLVYDARRLAPEGPTVFLPPEEVRWSTCRSTPRAPVLGTFRAETFDFTVVGVHLRAQGDRGCGGTLYRDQVRKSETHALMDYLTKHQALKMVDQDIIMVGDLNVEAGHPSIAPLLTRGLTLLTKPSDMSPISGAWSYRTNRYQSALDHVLISAPAQREYIPRSAKYPRKFSEMTAEELRVFRTHLSDHAPVSARFRTDLGDDD